MVGDVLRQLFGVLDGLWVLAFVPLEAGAVAGVGVPAGGPAPLGLFARSQVSVARLKRSPTAAQYAAIVAAGRVTRSSESMTTGGVPPALVIAACISHSRSMPIALMVIGATSGLRQRMLRN